MIYCSWHSRFTKILKTKNTRIAESKPVQPHHVLVLNPNFKCDGHTYTMHPLLFVIIIYCCGVCVCVYGVVRVVVGTYACFKNIRGMRPERWCRS